MLLPIAALCLAYAQEAGAVVLKKNFQDNAATDWVRSGVASRAHSDVQVRRLMQMFAAKEIDSEALYQRLQLLRDSKSRQ